MSDNRKNIMMALGAGAALIGAALIYHFVTSGDDSNDVEVPEVSHDELVESLKKENLIEVPPRQNGQIDTNYFLRLLQFVGKTTREMTADKRKYLTAERRSVYNKDEAAYAAIVKQTIELEDQAAQKILRQILEQVNISEQEFGMTHQILASNPQFAEFVMAAQQGKLSQPDPNQQPKLTKQQTLNHLKKTQTVQIEQMKTIGSSMNLDKPPTNEAEQMEMMTKMMAEQFKAQDKIWFETGSEFENEEFEAALLHYCAKDKEVAQQMQIYMTKMREASAPHQ